MELPGAELDKQHQQKKSKLQVLHNSGITFLGWGRGTGHGHLGGRGLGRECLTDFIAQVFILGLALTIVTWIHPRMRFLVLVAVGMPLVKR